MLPRLLAISQSAPFRQAGILFIAKTKRHSGSTPKDHHSNPPISIGAEPSLFRGDELHVAHIKHAIEGLKVALDLENGRRRTRERLHFLLLPGDGEGLGVR